MRRGKVFIATLGAAAALLAAPGALAATPQDVYNDLADNGRLDGNYTAQELKAALNNPTVQGYGKPSVIPGLKPAIKKQLNKPAAGVAGAQQPPAGPLGAQAESGNLPFTGLDVGLIFLGGLVLLALGMTLRRLGRDRA